MRPFVRCLLRLFPLRLPGLLVLAGALFLRAFSREAADHLLAPVALAGMGLVGTCALASVLGAIALRRGLRRFPAGVPSELETGTAQPTQLAVPRLGRWMILEVGVSWVAPAEVKVALEPAGRWFREWVTPLRRGRCEAVTRRFTVEDVFGLTAVSFDWTREAPVQILPFVGPCAAMLLPSQTSGDAWSHPAGRAEGDLVEMRAYAHGDSMRHVLWKVFARSRRLLVRMPERAMAPHPASVAFLVAGAEDEPTAGLARVFVERGLLGTDFLFAGDGATRPTNSVPDAVAQIVDSVEARSDGGAQLAALAAQIDPARLLSCVVFAPPVDGPWRERVTALARQLASAATVVIGVDGPLEAPPVGGRLQRWFLKQEAVHAVSSLPALRSSLEADGFRVQVYHRPTGQAL